MVSEPLSSPVAKGFWYGTSSWSEAGWKGPFYPTDLPKAEWLSFYAREFPSVEADVTYYRVPSQSMTSGWAEKTPEPFRLCAKFPKDIVHAGKGAAPDATKLLVPAHTEALTAAFLAAMSRLGHKCGPLLLQFPYFNQKAFREKDEFFERLFAFLDQLPGDFRYAVELRNAKWIGPELLEALRARQVCLAFVDLKYMPHPDSFGPPEALLTTDFAYVRLIGDRDATEALTETFDRIVIDRSPALARWAAYLGPLLRRLPETFAFANNHFAGHGPSTMRELLALLRPGQADRKEDQP